MHNGRDAKSSRSPPRDEYVVVYQSRSSTPITAVGIIYECSECCLICAIFDTSTIGNIGVILVDIFCIHPSIQAPFNNLYAWLTFAGPFMPLLGINDNHAAAPDSNSAARRPSSLDGCICRLINSGSCNHTINYPVEVNLKDRHPPNFNKASSPALPTTYVNTSLPNTISCDIAAHFLPFPYCQQRPPSSQSDFFTDLIMMTTFFQCFQSSFNTTRKAVHPQTTSCVSIPI